MSEGTAWRKIRCPDDLWAQLDTAVATATAGEGDRSAVTRTLWRLYIDLPAIRKAVHGKRRPASAAPVATITTGVDQLRQRVATLRAYGYETGLPRADVQDTIKTWLDWYATQPVHCDFARIEQALRARADGQEWRPQT